MKKMLMVPALVLAVAAGSHAATAETDFQAANRAFGEGKYGEAAAGYERIVKERGYSAAVLFNLGNAYFHQGRAGRAILNYERALRLSPRDPDIHANLKYARDRAGLPQPLQGWWRQALQSLTPSQWAWAASFCFSLFCLLLVVRMVRAEWIRRVGVGAALVVPAWRSVLFLAGFGCLATAACAAVSARDRPEAIVVSKEASLLISPFDKSETLATLPEGESVSAEKKFGSYILVRYEKDKSGWVSETQVAPVDPHLLDVKALK